MIKRGDIVLLSFPFTNLTTTKVRPALVVSDDSFNKVSKDAIFLFITKKKYTTPFDLRINNANTGFKTSGLKESSTIRVSKVMCLEQKLVRRRLGFADRHILNRVDSALKCLFNLS